MRTFLPLALLLAGCASTVTPPAVRGYDWGLEGFLALPAAAGVRCEPSPDDTWDGAHRMSASQHFNWTSGRLVPPSGASPAEVAAQLERHLVARLAQVVDRVEENERPHLEPGEDGPFPSLRSRVVTFVAGGKPGSLHYVLVNDPAAVRYAFSLAVTR